MPDARRGEFKTRSLAATLAMLGVVIATACAPTATAPTQPVEEQANVTVTPQQVRSFMIDGTASIESNSDYSSTTLTIDVTKLDNSIASDMTVVVTFGDVRCESRRPYSVYPAEKFGGKLFEGETGYHLLRCEPFTPASEFADLPKGAVE